MSVATAPAKVILFGEHFVVHGTQAILCAINKRAKVTSSLTSQRTITIQTQLGNTQIDVDDDSIVAEKFRPFAFIAKKILAEFKHSGGIDITIESEIPLGVGLGSSSACCVAAAGSIYGLFGKKSKQDILDLAIEAERTIFANVSGADSAACTFGGIIEYGKDAGFKRLDVNSDLHLVVANSMQEHSTGKLVSDVDKFRQKNDAEFSSLCTQESQLVSNAKNAILSNDLVAIGKHMRQNQEYLEHIGVSNEKLQKMIVLADAKSYGSKLTGAGGGGCIISLVDQDKSDDVICRMQENNYDCFVAPIDYTGLDIV